MADKREFPHHMIKEIFEQDGEDNGDRSVQSEPNRRQVRFLPSGWTT